MKKILDIIENKLDMLNTIEFYLLKISAALISFIITIWIFNMV